MSIEMILQDVIKRVALGLVNFRHHRVRCPLYDGKPDWAPLKTIQP